MRSIIIITPVRNEAKYLEKTIASVAAQTLLPTRWIMVNDGSTDHTAAIINHAASQYPWITAVHRPDRGFRKSGVGVVEAFYDGYASLRDSGWDFLIKLDGDLAFGPGYFSGCLDRFGNDPKLGIGGGTICRDAGGTLEVESTHDPRFHVRGATKIYRRACWEAIGGLVRATGWDTIDEIKANMLGWNTYSFFELKLLHHRYAGNADGRWKNWVKNGRANYNTGYHPLFMLLKVVSRLGQKPYVLASSGLLVGFLSGYLRRQPPTAEREVVRYVRDQQLRRLLCKKSLWS